MDIILVNNIRQEIYRLLDDRHLKLAFRKLKQLSGILNEWRFTERISDLETAYQYMLRYMEEGISDPDRDKMYLKLLSDTYNLTDLISDRLLSIESSSMYYGKRRVFLNGSDSLQNCFKRFDNELNNLSLAELLKEEEKDPKKIIYLRKKVENEASMLFNAIWCNFPATPEEYEILQEIFSLTACPQEYHSLMISALTLNLLEWFDENKVQILIGLTENENEELSQRALIGLVLILLKNEKRSEVSKLLSDRLESLFENTEIIRSLHSLQLQLIRTRETESITRKLNEEILPEMLKINPDLYDKIKSDDLFSDSGEPDMNPEWEEYLKNSDLGDKLKEISELQIEGSDVLMSAFSNLKNFPFFSTISNWFIPFFQKNTVITTENEVLDNTTNHLLNVIGQSQFLCNSDKYSFWLSMSHIPASQREAMTGHFNSQGEELNKLQEEEKIESPDKIKDNIANQYIHDLYRFYKLNPRKDEFKDLFAGNLSFYNHPSFRKIFQKPDTLKLIAELFFQKKYYSDALLVFRELARCEHSSYDVYQKIGYCLQAMGKTELALDAFLQADIIYPDSLWTLRKIALCYRNLKKPAKALEYYKRISAIKPEDLNVLLNTGHCHLELKEYENALSCYFKVDYLDQKSNRAWRPVAWCSFLIGKFEQARRYYGKILADNPSALDYINAGHTEWSLRNFRAAIEYYKQSLAVEKDNGEFFEKILTQDLSDLLAAGIPEKEIPLMMDQIMYDAEEK